jgi:hypothetical protein
MLNRTLLGGALALAVLAGPMAASPASAHPPGPAKCWAWGKHHWVWVCKKRHHYVPIYQPYIYDPYVYSYPFYDPFFYGPFISFSFNTGHHHHHHHMKKW